MFRTPQGPFFEPDGPQDPKRHLQRELGVSFWTCFWEAKSSKKASKFSHEFRRVFWSTFLWILVSFWEHFASIFDTCFRHIYEHAILVILKDVSCVWHTFAGPGPSGIESKSIEKLSGIRETFLIVFYQI